MGNGETDHFIQVTGFGPVDYLTSAEARRLARALFATADALDEAQS